jgi:hypothetical protein
MKDRLVRLSALAVALLSSASFALEIENVKVSDQASLGGSAPPLVLNGAGVRHKLAFLKIYVGALYLPAKKTSTEEVLRDPGPKRVALHVLVDELTAKELTASLNNALAANHIPAELALIESRIQDLNRMMGSLGAVRKGGVVLVDYLPGVGTRVTVNGEEKITIRGEDFYRALLRIWIGAKPVDGRLRDAMLGGSGSFRLF